MRSRLISGSGKANQLEIYGGVALSPSSCLQIPLFNACNVGAQASGGRLPDFPNPSQRREAKLNAVVGNIAADLRKDWTSAVWGKRVHVGVVLGGRGIIKQKNTMTTKDIQTCK